ncbi:helix-turn-helix domain-containing protein [Sphingomonas sp. PB2P19]|uniref:helix-turn-helix domain-containing protein n=1 Tax=Sphingomonas rhamnosi TaxID=3096156 RepID=UPI002FC6A1F0
MKARIWEIEGTMAHAQRRAIVEALEACDGSAGKAAARLKIGRSTVYRLIDIYAVPVKGAGARGHEAASPAHLPIDDDYAASMSSD